MISQLLGVFLISWHKCSLKWRFFLVLPRQCLIRFDMLCWCLHSFQAVFYFIFSLISPITHCLFSSILFRLQEFAYIGWCILTFWYPVLLHNGLRRCMVWFHLIYFSEASFMTYNVSSGSCLSNIHLLWSCIVATSAFLLHLVPAVPVTPAVTVNHTTQLSVVPIAHIFLSFFLLEPASS